MNACLGEVIESVCDFGVCVCVYFIQTQQFNFSSQVHYADIGLAAWEELFPHHSH
jgi:hypothetical protein